MLKNYEKGQKLIEELSQKISKKEKILNNKLDSQKTVEPDYNIRSSSLLNLELQYRQYQNDKRDKIALIDHAHVDYQSLLKKAQRLSKKLIKAKEKKNELDYTLQKLKETHKTLVKTAEDVKINLVTLASN